MNARPLSPTSPPSADDVAAAHVARAPSPLFLAHLAGDQATMGSQHGAMVRAAGGWRPAVTFYPRMPERLLADAPPLLRLGVRPVVAHLVARLERHRDPALRARTRAFMAAVGASPRWSRHYHVMDAFQNVVNLAARHRLGPMAHALPPAHLLAEAAPPACSTLVAWGAATPDGALRHARNFDFPGVGVWDRAPAVVFCTPERGLRYGFVTTRGADVCGITAFNEAGLVITAHTRFHPDVALSGRPVVDLTHDIIRQAPDLDAAERVARAAPSASTWALCVSSAAEHRAMSLEITGRAVRRIDPTPGDAFLAVTNHYLDPELAAGAAHISPGFDRNTRGRHAWLTALGRRGGLDAAALRAALASHADPDVPGAERASGACVAQLLAVQSVVIEPTARRLHLSVGPAPTGAGPWAVIDWSWSDRPGFRIETFDGPDAPALETAGASRYHHGPRAVGYGSLVAAAAATGRGEAASVVAAHLADAVAADPDEPTYRLLAGGACLRERRVRDALAHFEVGGAHEPSPFFAGQLHLWASRAAAALGDQAVASAHRDRLYALTSSPTAGHVAPLIAEAQRDAERGRALSPRALSRVRLNHHLAELSL